MLTNQSQGPVFSSFLLDKGCGPSIWGRLTDSPRLSRMLQSKAAHLVSVCNVPADAENSCEFPVLLQDGNWIPYAWPHTLSVVCWSFSHILMSIASPYMIPYSWLESFCVSVFLQCGVCHLLEQRGCCDTHKTLFHPSRTWVRVFTEIFSRDIIRSDPPFSFRCWSKLEQGLVDSSAQCSFMTRTGNRPRRDSESFAIGQSVLRSPPSTLDSPIQGVFNRRENNPNSLFNEFDCH